MTAADAILGSVFGLGEPERQIRQLAVEYAALRIVLDDERKVCGVRACSRPRATGAVGSSSASRR